MTTTVIHVADLDPVKLFKDNDFYQQLDTKIDINNDTYKHDYGFGLKTYSQHLYIVNNKNKTMYYLTADEELTQAEQDELAKHCQCSSCTYSWSVFNISSWFTWRPCPCCVGCLNSPFPQQHVIKNSRNKMIKM